MRACGSNPPFFPSAYLEAVELDRTLPDTDRAEAADPPRIAQQLALDAKPLLAVLVDDQPRPPLAELGIDVFLPQRERFEDVTIGIDDVVGESHDPFSFPMRATR